MPDAPIEPPEVIPEPEPQPERQAVYIPPSRRLERIRRPDGKIVTRVVGQR